MRHITDSTSLFYCIAAFALSVLVGGCGGPDVGSRISANVEALSISITKPDEGAVVDTRSRVEGNTSGAEEEIWVVVHPTEVGGYWVQPKPTIQSDGSWGVSAYFGQPGTTDSGKVYEIRAVANPTVPLSEGDQFGAWPAAEAISDAITVIRR